MDMDILMDHLGKGMFLALLLSMPAVLFAAVIGLVVGILQAVTQVQEQTIAAAPKIMGVFLLLIFSGGLMMNAMGEYMREAFHIGFEEIPGEGPFVLAAPSQLPAEKRADQFFTAEQAHPLPNRLENLKPR